MQFIYRHSSFFLLAIIFLSLTINFAPLFTQSIRLDESQSLWVATKSITGIIQYIATDVHLPLYHILLHFWTQVLGTDIVIARLMSLLFFMLTLVALYKFALEATENKLVALLTITLFSLSPFIMWYSSETRMYTLFTFIVSLSHLFYLRMIRTNGESGKLWYFLTTLIGFYTHYFFIMVVITQMLYTFFALRGNRAFLIRYVFLTCLAFTPLVPWLSYVMQLGETTNAQPNLDPPTSFNLIQTFVNFIFGFQNNAIQSILISLWPIAVILLFFIFTKRNKLTLHHITYVILATFLPILLAYGASFLKPVFLARYLILTTPTLFLLLSWLILSFSKHVFSLVPMTILILLFSALLAQNRSTQAPVKENYVGVTKYLEKQAKPQDIIAVSAPFTVYPIEYSYEGVTRIDTIPAWNRYEEGGIPQFSEKNLERQINEYKKKYTNMYVVLSYDQGYEQQVREFLDKRYALLKKVPYEPNIELRIYRLRYD